jgi:methylenetetrahydrofolate dehydrogenase (NADP+)/methenyltetrahydrofolate cyclohydrolase
VHTARIIDGKVLAAGLTGRVAAAVARLARDNGLVPGLAVVLVGEDAASQVYVRSKVKATIASGLVSTEHKLPGDTTQAELLDLIAGLNGDGTVHGILVQLPLPGQIDAARVIEAIDPAKDVDGFHPLNVGRLSSGAPALAPCTPLGCVMLAKEARGSLRGLEAVVVGRSNIVGKPVAQLLLREDCTVTIAHSRTRDLAGVVRRADIVVAAVGKPRMIGGDWIKPGATVIDVGINRVASAGGKSRLVGDVDFEAAVQAAGAITPVPGGVGPMTIACLLRNTVVAAAASLGLPLPDELR